MVSFESVLMVGEGDKATLGAPFVAGATVGGRNRRSRPAAPASWCSRRSGARTIAAATAHRQDLTLLRITEILTDGKKPSAKPAKAKKAEAKPAKLAKAEKDEAPAKAEDEAAVAGVAPAALEAPEGKADDLKKITGRRAEARREVERHRRLSLSPDRRLHAGERGLGGRSS